MNFEEYKYQYEGSFPSPICLAATGHRPPKLGGYKLTAELALLNLACKWLRKEYADALASKSIALISGMALGWDTAWAQAAVQLHIPFIAAIPFKGQEYRWPGAAQLRYRELLERAAQVVPCSEGDYAPKKMQIRNEWMVDNCTSVVALWDGSSGGTANCVAYAKQVGRPVVNLWENWNAQTL